MLKLVMKRGKREVLIGLFPNRYRVDWTICHLDWTSGWKPVVSLEN